MWNVQGVLFDFNGTLARTANCGESHQAVFDRWGLSEVGHRWGDRWLVGPSDGEDHREHSGDAESYHRWELQRLSSRARRCGVPAALLDEVVAELDRVNKTITMTLYDDVVDVLAELRRWDVTVAVCSNWYWDIDLAMEQVGLTDLLDVAVASARVGVRKPHPMIYHRTLQQCGLQPAEALFVGDRWRADVVGALDVGMAAAHLRRPDRLPEVDTPARDGVSRLSSLHDVLDEVRRHGRR